MQEPSPSNLNLRFTNKARRALALAHLEAQRLGSLQIGPEYILLGMIRDGDGAGATVLKKLNLDLQEIGLAIEKAIEKANENDPSISQPSGSLVSALLQEPPMTSPASSIIEYAIDEAQKLGHGHLGTEHLLLGLLRDQNGIAGKVLTTHGITVELARKGLADLSDSGARESQ